eukprot:Skav207676  [mRNA]  locus=scaffold1857:356458:367282:- [translate_table: standard]
MLWMSQAGAGLLEVFWKTRQVEYVEADPKLIRGSEERFKHVFTKLHCFGCDEYEKVVLLDIDLLVRDNIDELKNLTPPCAMRRGHKSLPAHVNGARSCYNNQGQQKFGMNLGVAVFKPSGAELSKMLKSIQSRDPMHETCHGPEQDFLTRWFNVQNRTWTRLDLKYNYQLHQLANSMEHVGAEAERLQLKFENVKVFHYSGKVKPWDFYFDSDEASFAQFCDQKLLPAYKAQGAVFEEKIQRAAQLWKDHCEVWGPDVTADIRQPKPQDFRKVMAFVASVLERRPSGADEDAVVEEQGKDDETHEVSKGPEAPGTAPSSTTEATSTTELPQSSECKTLHLVLYPPPKKRSYDESPLGRLREEILQEVAANRVTIIVAPTGCGKRIPQMILDEDPAQRSILVTQPRRVAATSLARDAHIDFLLSLVVTRVLVENDKIKIILMSAAMDSQKIAKYFENALRCTVPRPLDLEKCQEFKIRIKYIDDLPFFTQRRIVRQPDGTWVESDGLSDDLSQEVEDVASLHSDFIRSCHKERSARADLGSFLVLEDLLLSIFELPNLGDPRDFVAKMPDAPDKSRVDQAIARLMELNAVADCAILAAVHQRGDPFLDAMNLTREEDEARWCAQHFLSLEKLHELEEMVLQIRDVLEELGYAESLPKAEKQRMLQRRHEKHLSATHVKSPPLASAAKDFRHLLGAEDREKELMLAWCIAASFTSGLVEVKTGSSTEQLKYKPKEDREPEEVYLCTKCSTVPAGIIPFILCATYPAVEVEKEVLDTPTLVLPVPCVEDLTVCKDRFLGKPRRADQPIPTCLRVVATLSPA